jgi:peroxiredoxin Q/BCP
MPPKKTRAAAPKKASPQKKAESSATTATAKGLKVGDVLPKGWEVVNELEETKDLAQLFEKQGGILFFYPKANTPGCTTQACGFRDNFDAIAKKGYAVYGMSADSPTSQGNWKKKHQFQYHLLSDRSKDRKVLKALGVNKAPSSISRSHLIIGKGGVVEQVAYGVSPKESVEKATAFVV